MKTIIKNVIERGDYSLGALLNKINRYHIEGALSDSDRDELTSAAREHANSRGGVDVYAKLEELDRRVAQLEAERGSGSDTSGGDTAAVPEYVAGKWYYAGARVTFGGRVYECAAPEGVVCTWSPSEYPAYWNETV